MKLPIRVLQVIGIMNRGGAENMIMNLYRNIDRSKIQFDFVEHTQAEAAFDSEILSLGGDCVSLSQIPSNKSFYLYYMVEKVFTNARR